MAVMLLWRSRRAEILQQRDGSGERAGRWPVLKRQIGRRGPPGGAFQHEAGQFCFQNFRSVEGGQAPVQRRRPEADRSAGSLAAGAAGSLVGGGARDADSAQPGQAGRRVKARRPAPAAVDHDTDARDGQRCLGDGGSQNDAAGLRRPQSAVLLGRRKIAVQRQDKRAATFQRGLGAADFRHAGEKSEDVAIMLRQRRSDGSGDSVRQVADMGNVARLVLHRDRKHAAGAFDDIRIHQPRQAGAIGGGRHRQQTEIGPQHALQIEA